MSPTPIRNYEHWGLKEIIKMSLYVLDKIASIIH